MRIGNVLGLIDTAVAAAALARIHSGTFCLTDEQGQPIVVLALGKNDPLEAAGRSRSFIKAMELAEAASKDQDGIQVDDGEVTGAGMRICDTGEAIALAGPSAGHALNFCRRFQEER